METTAASIPTNPTKPRLHPVLYWFLYFLFVLFASTFLLFAVLEFSPPLARNPFLLHIKYYATRETYIPDPQLAFAYRAHHHIDVQFFGDRFSGDEGVPVPGIHYVANYTAENFRVNSSAPPYDVAVIGDSYVEVGETDDSTLSERIKATSGLSTYNLGRGWYGPNQYLEMLKRYAIPLHPKYALFCFFSGNDIEDLKAYKRWQRTGRYYSFEDPARAWFVRRYFAAFFDTAEYLVDAAVKSWRGREGHGLDPDLGVFQIGPDKVRLKFDSDYWNATKTAGQLLATEPWQDLGSVLKQFHDLSAAQGITPVVVYIPTTAQTYAAQFTGEGGSDVQENIRTTRQFQSNAAEALGALADKAQTRYVNLLPVFQCLGKQKLLHYQFDTHWNRDGRDAAAQYITYAGLAGPAPRSPDVAACTVASRPE